MCGLLMNLDMNFEVVWLLMVVQMRLLVVFVVKVEMLKLLFMIEFQLMLQLIVFIGGSWFVVEVKVMMLVEVQLYVYFRLILLMFVLVGMVYCVVIESLCLGENGSCWFCCVVRMGRLQRFFGIGRVGSVSFWICVLRQLQLVERFNLGNGCRLVLIFMLQMCDLLVLRMVVLGVIVLVLLWKLSCIC